MTSDGPRTQFAVALTQVSLGKIPPNMPIATGHDDHVMLFLVGVGDAKAAADILMDFIMVSESDAIVRGFTATGGLLRKQLHIDDAQQIRDRLELTGTVVEFIRPDEYGGSGPAGG